MDGLTCLLDDFFNIRIIVRLFGVLERQSNQSHDNIVCELGLSDFFELTRHGVQLNFRVFITRLNKNLQTLNFYGNRTLNLFDSCVFMFNDLISRRNLSFTQLGVMSNHFFPRLVCRTFDEHEFFDKSQIFCRRSVFWDGVCLGINALLFKSLFDVRFRFCFFSGCCIFSGNLRFGILSLFCVFNSRRSVGRNGSVVCKAGRHKQGHSQKGGYIHQCTTHGSLLVAMW